MCVGSNTILKETNYIVCYGSLTLIGLGGCPLIVYNGSNKVHGILSSAMCLRRQYEIFWLYDLVNILKEKPFAILLQVKPMMNCTNILI